MSFHWKKALHAIGLRPHRPILLNTMPRSGSRYVFNAIREGLGLSGFPALHPFHYEGAELHDAFFKQMVKGNRISQSHLSPVPYNIERLAARMGNGGKVIVHVRDPRQALLSWMHLQLGNGVETTFPDGSVQMCADLEWKDFADLVIAKELDYFIDFANGWLEVLRNQDRGFDMLMTRQDTLSEEPDAFFAEVLDFLEAPRWQFIAPEPPKVGKLHYRKNNPDEWRESFTTSQQKILNDALSDEACKTFGWSKG